MPMILYAEFTAKPGSESEVGRIISGLAEKVRREPATSSSPSIGSATIQVSSSFSSSISMRPALNRTSAPSTADFNRQLSSLIEEVSPS